jgi:hypothetical protein
VGRQGCRRWAGVKDVPLAKHEQKQSIALFAAQGLESLTKSEALPTQSYLNFECKVWHCSFFIIKQFFQKIDLIKFL